jgi:hypothetical protein
MDGSSRWMAIDDGVLRRIRLGAIVVRTRVSQRMGWAASHCAVWSKLKIPIFSGTRRVTHRREKLPVMYPFCFRSGTDTTHR